MEYAWVLGCSGAQCAHFWIRSGVSAVGIELCPGNGQVTSYELLASGPQSVVYLSGGWVWCLHTDTALLLWSGWPYWCFPVFPTTSLFLQELDKLHMTSWCVDFVVLLHQVTLSNPICLLGGTLESGASQIEDRSWMGESRDKTLRL